MNNVIARIEAKCRSGFYDDFDRKEEERDERERKKKGKRKMKTTRTQKSVKSKKSSKTEEPVKRYPRRKGRGEIDRFSFPFFESESTQVNKYDDELEWELSDEAEEEYKKRRKLRRCLIKKHLKSHDGSFDPTEKNDEHHLDEIEKDEQEFHADFYDKTEHDYQSDVDPVDSPGLEEKLRKEHVAMVVKRVDKRRARKSEARKTVLHDILKKIEKNNSPQSTTKNSNNSTINGNGSVIGDRNVVTTHNYNYTFNVSDPSSVSSQIPTLMAHAPAILAQSQHQMTQYSALAQPFAQLQPLAMVQPTAMLNGQIAQYQFQMNHSFNHMSNQSFQTPAPNQFSIISYEQARQEFKSKYYGVHDSNWLKMCDMAYEAYKNDANALKRGYNSKNDTLPNWLDTQRKQHLTMVHHRRKLLRFIGLYH